MVQHQVVLEHRDNLKDLPIGIIAISETSAGREHRNWQLLWSIAWDLLSPDRWLVIFRSGHGKDTENRVESQRYEHTFQVPGRNYSRGWDKEEEEAFFWGLGDGRVHMPESSSSLLQELSSCIQPTTSIWGPQTTQNPYSEAIPMKASYSCRCSRNVADSCVVGASSAPIRCKTCMVDLEIRIQLQRHFHFRNRFS